MCDIPGVLVEPVRRMAGRGRYRRWLEQDRTSTAYGPAGETGVINPTVKAAAASGCISPIRLYDTRAISLDVPRA